MPLPIYEEIHLKKLDLASLEYAFLEQDLGQRPAILVLPEKGLEFQRKMITNILLVLKKHQINPRFPYPIYVVADIDIQAKNIPLIPRGSYAPRFFYCKNTKVTNRETNMLHKIKILKEKLGNSPLDEKLEYLFNHKEKKRELFEKSLETSFYQSILNPSLRR